VLSSLAETSTPKALELAVAMLDDPATRAEAIQAVTKIADGLKAHEADVSKAALTRVLEVSTDPEERKRASAVLEQLTSATAVTTADPHTSSAATH
ncbi:MAG: hypothetical protein ACR2IE_01095, partial [Candidatus Sumerlaeaceae bacterium]